MNYLFGVDGGGSGCRVVLTSTDGKILGKAKGGSARHLRHAAAGCAPRYRHRVGPGNVAPA